MTVQLRLPLLSSSLRLSLPLLLLVACTGGDASTGESPDLILPTGPVQPPLGGGVAPGLNGPMFLAGGAYSFTGAVAPGTASVVDSPVIDEFDQTGPMPASAASFDVTVGGINYVASNADTMSMTFDDGLGSSYTAVSIFNLDDPNMDIGTVVHVIVPSAEVVAGTTVSLDGDDRIALFAHGDLNQPEPSVWGAAASGSISFTSGGSASGDLITAQISGDFGEIVWNDPGPGTGTGTGTTGGLVAGDYQLEFIAVDDVMCDGDLLGSEASFQALSLSDLGFADGAATLTLTGTSSAEVSGAGVLASYGTSALSMDAMGDGPSGAVFGAADRNNLGPAGTDEVSAFLLLDTDNANANQVYAMAGVGFVNANATGSCTVIVSAQLVP